MLLYLGIFNFSNLTRVACDMPTIANHLRHKALQFLNFKTIFRKSLKVTLRCCRARVVSLKENSIGKDPYPHVNSFSGSLSFILKKKCFKNNYNNVFNIIFSFFQIETNAATALLFSRLWFAHCCAESMNYYRMAMTTKRV